MSPFADFIHRAGPAYFPEDNKATSTERADPHPTFTMNMHPSPNQPVSSVDLARYLGLWHEMAHLPMFFQRKCADQITATYTQNSDGTIGILNACRIHAGTSECSRGIAKLEDRSGAGEALVVAQQLAAEELTKGQTVPGGR